MDIAPKCLRCSTAMEEGFIADKGQHVIAVSTWVQGKPEPSFWTGTKMSGKEQHPVQTYRCPQCGYLESYAA